MNAFVNVYAEISVEKHSAPKCPVSKWHPLAAHPTESAIFKKPPYHLAIELSSPLLSREKNRRIIQLAHFKENDENGRQEARDETR